MKKLVLASVSALALLGAAACSDNSTDNTTTQSTNPPAEQPAAPATPDAAAPADNNAGATDNSTTQSITPDPQSGTGGDQQNKSDTAAPDTTVQPAAPAQ